MSNVTVGQDIHGIKILGIIIVWWPSLWVGTVNQACQRFGSISSN